MNAIQSVESRYMAVDGIVQNASIQHFEDVCCRSVQSIYMAVHIEETDSTLCGPWYSKCTINLHGSASNLME